MNVDGWTTHLQRCKKLVAPSTVQWITRDKMITSSSWKALLSGTNRQGKGTNGRLLVKKKKMISRAIEKIVASLKLHIHFGELEVRRFLLLPKFLHMLTFGSESSCCIRVVE